MAYQEREVEPSAVTALVGSERLLWIVAIVFFGIGDLVTTGVGLHLEQVAEVGPVVGDVIVAYGTVAMVGLKLFVFGVGYALWRIVPAPHRVGVPLGLAVLGILVTIWNVGVLAVVVL